jgi:hypothetical protein
MNMLMYWTGVVVWLAISGIAAWLIIGEFLIVGFANSISSHRWRLSDPQSKFRWQKHWWALVKSVCAGAVEYAGYRNNGSSRLYTDRGGEWRGIGDWTPIPKQHKGESA